MYALGRISAFLILSMVCLCACKAGTQTPAPLTTINGAQGGKIVYGTVSGATTQAAAMSGMLKTVHNNCGEKPQIGKVFQFTGSNSVGVFFTVTDHPEGNIPLAGMVIAAATGPNQVQAAMVYDYASRFGQTANPLLQQLSGVWNPGAASGMAGSSAGSNANAPAAAGPTHLVTAPDNSASASVPAGWTVDKSSFDGGLLLHGANGELLELNMSKQGVDPTSAFQQKMAAAHATQAVDLANAVFYAYSGDPAKEFAPLLQAWLKSQGVTSSQVQVQNVQAMPGSQTAHCASASGQLNPSGGSAVAFSADICTGVKNQYGYYTVVVTLFLMPPALVNPDQAVVKAIVTSYKENQQVIQQEYQQATQMKQQQDQKDLAISQMVVNNIHQIGAQATARMNASEAANIAEQSSWAAGENANAQNNQGFNNYLLDQSVVQNNTTGAHTTNWNAAADAMVQSGKYSYVSNSNYIPGTDY
jgi:hypothetical protein